MDMSDTTMGNALMTSVYFIMNIGGFEHWIGLICPISVFKFFADFFLAFCQFFSDILFHSKRPFSVVC